MPYFSRMARNRMAATLAVSSARPGARYARLALPAGYLPGRAVRPKPAAAGHRKIGPAPIRCD